MCHKMLPPPMSILFLIFNHRYLFVSYEYDRYVGAKVFDFWRPLLRDVLERVGRVYGEAHQDDVCVGVGERAEAIVVLLSGRVPKGQLNLKLRHKIQ